MKIKSLPTVILLSALLVTCTHAQQSDFPVLTGPYFGQQPPGTEPVIFAPDILVKPKQAHSNIIFTKGGTQAYWCQNGIWFSKLDNGGWTIPRILPFSREEFSDDAPFLSADEKRLFFASKRPAPVSDTTRKENLWVVNIEEHGWSEPSLLPPVINQSFQHWQASVDSDGTLYFGHRLKPDGDRNIYYSTFKNGEYQKPQRLGNEINTEHNEMNPFIANNGSYLVFSRRNNKPLENGSQDVSLFVSFRMQNGDWSQAVNLKEYLKFQNSANCPFVTRDGKYLFFLDAYDGRYQRFWISADIIGKVKAKHPERSDFR